MENNSRISNSIVNLNFGIFAQIITSLLGFVSRSVFINTLGEEYLGINGLYTSILNVLSLTELGLSNVVIYSLYKPLADGDENKLAALMQFYKTVYRIIALVVAIIGICLIPMLKYIVNTDISSEKVVLYYIMFLANSVFSYLLVYKSSIINADQKMYLISKYTTVFKLLTTAIQVILLFTVGNFTLYLFVQIFMTLVNNIYISNKANKLYPFIKKKINLNNDEKIKIFSNVRHMFSYRLGGSLLNGTDNMYISSLVNTTTVGRYSNYTMISSMVSGYVNIVYNAIFSSIGNMNATASIEHKKEMFKVLDLIFAWMGVFCAVSLFSLYNDFITIWLGNEFVLSIEIVGVIVVNFYLPIVLYPIWSYRNTLGLFRETKNILVYAAIINIVLSYILGKQYGLFGILISTSIARLLTSFWYEPFILYKKVFNESVNVYFKRHIINIFIGIFSIIIIDTMSKMLLLNKLVTFVFKMCMCAIVPNIILLIVYHSKPEFIYIKNTILRKIK